MPPTAVIYLGTDNGIISLTDTGQQWRPEPAGLQGKRVLGIANPAESPATLYAIVAGHGLFKSGDTGQSWRQILSANAHSLLPDVTKPNRLWVGVEPASIQRTLNGGETWQDLSSAFLALPTALDWSFPDPPYQARVQALAQMPGRPDTVLAGVEIGGLVRSTDGGDTWTVSDEGLDEEIHALAVHPDKGHFWLAATGDGIYRSQDGGQTWHPASAGLSHLYAISAIILPSGVCLATATGTPPGNWVENATSALYRSTDQAGHWQALDLGSSIYISALAASTAGKRNVYLGTQSGEVYLSRDQGEVWEEIAQLSTGVNTIMATSVG